MAVARAVEVDLLRFLLLLGFALARLALLMTDMYSAMMFRRCALALELPSPPRAGIQGLLVSIVCFNFLTLTSFALFLAIRLTADPRSYSEARFVTSVFVILSVPLKLIDVALPMAAAAVLVKDSDDAPYISQLQGCSDVFFGLYFLYALLKVAVGLADIALTTRFKWEKTKDWYSQGGNGIIRRV